MSIINSVVITGLTGKYAGAQISLKHNEEIVFGRDPNYCNVVFDQFSTSVSRKHCTIRYNAQESLYYVIDCSKNGTFLDDGRRLIPNMSTPLPRGSEIFIGNRKNSFRLN